MNIEARVQQIENDIETLAEELRFECKWACIRIGSTHVSFDGETTSIGIGDRAQPTGVLFITY